MVQEVSRCPSYVEIGEARVAVQCERGEGHRGRHREYFESVDEHSQKSPGVEVCTDCNADGFCPECGACSYCCDCDDYEDSEGVLLQC